MLLTTTKFEGVGRRAVQHPVRLACALVIACVGASHSPFVHGGSPEATGAAVPVAEANRKLAQEEWDAFNRGDMVAVAELCAENTRNFGRPVGRKGMLAVLKDIQTTFPDVHFTPKEYVAEGDWVAVRGIFSGTHRGVGRLPVCGGMLVGVQPTGRYFEVQHIHMTQVRGGKMIEHFANRDDLGMMQQLGLLPAPGSKGSHTPFVHGSSSEATGAAVPVAEANRKLVQAVWDAVNRGDMVAAAALFAENTRNHGRPVGRKGVLAVLEEIQTTFPDVHFTPKEYVAEGEWVVVRGMFSGTHRGVGRLPVCGGMLVGVQPTGRHFEVQNIHMMQVRGGKIIEHFANRDDLGMMRQLGLLPAPDSKGKR